MSHPLLGHDYTEKHNEESEKEYRARVRKGMRASIAHKMKDVYASPSGIYVKKGKNYIKNIKK